MNYSNYKIYYGNLSLKQLKERLGYSSDTIFKGRSIHRNGTCYIDFEGKNILAEVEGVVIGDLSDPDGDELDCATGDCADNFMYGHSYSEPEKMYILIKTNEDVIAGLALKIKKIFVDKGVVGLEMGKTNGSRQKQAIGILRRLDDIEPSDMFRE